MLNITVDKQDFINAINNILTQLKLNKDDEFKKFLDWQQEINSSFFKKYFIDVENGDYAIIMKNTTYRPLERLIDKLERSKKYAELNITDTIVITDTELYHFYLSKNKNL